MKGFLVTLILIAIFLAIIVLLIIYIKSVVGGFLEKYFGTRDLKEAIEKSEIESENTPKSLSSMETLSLSSLRKDFPELNINEIKSMAENAITNYLRAIEKKKIEDLNSYNDNIKNMVLSKIEDLGDNKVSYEDIKYHKTVINRYEKSKSIATLYMASALEYYRKDDKIRKKIQDRFLVEIIYIIDPTEVDEDKKLLGLNCPNCGAPITTLGEKYCRYCDTGIKDLVKRTWVVNNIKEY
jgi:hypothetical protein